MTTITTATSTAAPVRLTRRGRAVVSLVLLLAVLAGLALVLAWGPGVVATGGAGDPVPVRTITIQPGQTLWDVALASNLGGDPRDVVRQIQQLNALSDAGALQVGQQLAVPVG